MRRRRPDLPAGSEVPGWVCNPPRWIFVDDGVPSPDGPNETWAHLVTDLDLSDAFPVDAIRMHGIWHAEVETWCADRGLVLEAAIRGRAIPGPLLAPWTEQRGLLTA